MEATGPAPPELDALGSEAVATPVRRPGDGAGKALGHLGRPPLEPRPVRDRLALRRGPGAELAGALPGGEVGVGLGRVETGGVAGDDHLAPDGEPAEDQAGPGVLAELAALGAVVVGEPREAAGVDALEEHVAGPGGTGGVGGGQDHGGGLGQPGRDRGVEPPGELLERVGGQLGGLHGAFLVPPGEAHHRPSCELVSAAACRRRSATGCADGRRAARDDAGSPPARRTASPTMAARRCWSARGALARV